MHTRATILTASLLAASSLARAEITLIGAASISGSARDKSGLTELVGPKGQEPKLPHDLLGSFGSGIDYLGRDNLYVACDDRGPANGEIPWRSRFQTFRISIAPGDKEPVKVELVSTTLLTDESGAPLDGIASALNSGDPLRALRFDAESIRITSTGTLLISDEYGPWIDEFSMSGTRLRRLPIPAKFAIASPSADPKHEIASNTSGREPNRGFEGLALSPDRTFATAILQSPLLQDHALSDKGKRSGLNVRMLHLPIAPSTLPTPEKPSQTVEWVYRLESSGLGINELLAIDDHRFLAIERDGHQAARRALYLVDPTGATDVSTIESLPAGALPDTITPVAKRRWLDFMDPRWHLAGDGASSSKMPEKIEGITLGPTIEVAGKPQRTLVVTTDNDLIPENPSWFWVFAFDDKDLGTPVKPTHEADAVK